jgi:hypothetical protein
MHTFVDFRQHHHFEELRRRLRSLGDPRRLERPLHFWALATDRRLPRALLGRVTRDIVETPFHQLCATPGIGRKKIETLLQLLERAVTDSGEELTHHGRQPVEREPRGSRRKGSQPSSDGAKFDPASVSETTWERWREAIKKHGLQQELLGRFAGSLQELPRVSWRTPLAEYADLTLQQLRGRRTHGVKRVRAVIDVFWAVQSLVPDDARDHVGVDVMPHFAAPLQAWLAEAAQHDEFPAFADVRRRFVEPLLKQLGVDANPIVLELVIGRLRLSKSSASVQATAQRLGLTRARVYQLLAEPAEIMEIRWPEGRERVAALARRPRLTRSSGRGATLFSAAAKLFFAVERGARVSK